MPSKPKGVAELEAHRAAQIATQATLARSKKISEATAALEELRRIRGGEQARLKAEMYERRNKG
jgi:hypothetical protein